ncbi:MAG: hypothetical protein AAGA30_11965 [Planctomycetota bacterium]
MIGRNLFAFFFALILCHRSDCHGQQGSTIRLKIKGKTYVSQFLGTDGKNIAILDSVGRIRLLPTTPRPEIKTISQKCKPLSLEQVRQSLKLEFGERYEISITENFAVVHPWGSSTTYAKPFETIYQRFLYFCKQNKIETKPSQLPLIAVVIHIPIKIIS